TPLFRSSPGSSGTGACVTGRPWAFTPGVAYDPPVPPERGPPMFQKLILTPFLVAALSLSLVANTANAGVIGTQQARSAELRSAKETRVRSSLARDDVRQAMQQLGVDPADAEARVASLSDAELLQLEGQLDRLPAGGDALAVIGVVFLVLLILELVGVTNVFNRI